MSERRELWIIGRHATTDYGHGIVTGARDSGYDVAHDDGTVGTYTWEADNEIGDKAENIPTDYPGLAGKYQALIEIIGTDLKVMNDLYPEAVKALPPGAARLLLDVVRQVRRCDIIADSFHNSQKIRHNL